MVAQFAERERAGVVVQADGVAERGCARFEADRGTRAPLALRRDQRRNEARPVD